MSDEGTPTLSSTTRVIVNVEDVNDHAPEFREKYLKALIPALADSNVFQVLVLLPLPAWETYTVIFRQSLTIFQAPNLISRERTRLDWINLGGGKSMSAVLSYSRALRKSFAQILTFEQSLISVVSNFHPAEQKFIANYTT